ncbi:pentapeptide repeat-containing protein [Aquifex sp.]
MEEEKRELTLLIIDALQDTLKVVYEEKPNFLREILSKIYELPSDKWEDIEEILVNIPYAKILNVFFKIIKHIQVVNEQDVLYVILSTATIKTVGEALSEFGLDEEVYNKLSDEDKKKIQNFIKEINEGLKNLKQKNPDIFDICKFDLNNFYENEAIKEILNLISKSVENLKEIKYEYKNETKKFHIEDFKRKSKEYLKKNFWLVVEGDKDRFKKFLEKIGNQSCKENLKISYKNTYYAEIIKEFEVEPIFNDKKEVALKDVYVEPYYYIYEDKNEHRIIKESILKYLYSAFKQEKPNLIIILGYPGEGKTSLARKIIYDFVNNQIDIYKNIYLLKLRYVKKPQDVLKENVEDINIESIKWELEQIIFRKNAEFKLEDFEDSIIILDGLDELLMAQNYLSDRADKFIEGLLTKLQIQYPNLKIVITSRLGYLNENKLARLGEDSIKILKLHEFTEEQQKEWIKKYSKFYPEKIEYLEKIENAPDYVKELTSQPILLYMIVSSEMDVSQIRSRIDVYEQLFECVIEKNWDKIKRHPVLHTVRKENLKNLLMHLAFIIFKNGREYVHKTILEKEETFKEKLKKIFRKYSPDVEELDYLLKGLLVLFYFVKRYDDSSVEQSNENDSNYAIEFYHKSIQEYLTAEYFYLEMLNLPDNIEEAEEKIWDLFSHRKMTKEIREFLEEIIQTRRDRDREKQNEFLEKLKKVFPSLLEKDFIVKPEEMVGENPLNKPLWCFGNLWIIAGKISSLYMSELENPTPEKWFLSEVFKQDEKYKELFARMIKLIRVLKDIYMGNFYSMWADLSRINLSWADLSWADLSWADLMEADLSRANLSEANLSRANLFGANLSWVNLSRANLSEANLSWANLSRANLSWADLSRADLSSANLSRADLSSANLSWAILRGANLEYADLQGAKFNPEEIKEAKNWQKAIYDEEQKKLLGLK